MKLKLQLQHKLWTHRFDRNFDQNMRPDHCAFFRKIIYAAAQDKLKISNRQISVRGVQKRHWQSIIVGRCVLTTHIKFQLHFINFNFEVENFNFKVKLSTSS